MKETIPKGHPTEFYGKRGKISVLRCSVDLVNTATMEKENRVLYSAEGFFWWPSVPQAVEDVVWPSIFTSEEMDQIESDVREKDYQHFKLSRLEPIA